MSILADLFNAGTGGVITGLIGSIATGITNFKMQKLNNEHQVKMVEVETNAMIAEKDAQIKVTETEVQGRLSEKDADIYHETIRQEGKRIVSNEMIAKLFESKWTAWLGSLIVFILSVVETLKVLIRPGLTLYLVGVTTWITMMAYHILTINENLISADEALALFKQVINIIIYLTVSCVTWWFGDRRTAKFLYRLNDGNLRK